MKILGTMQKELHASKSCIATPKAMQAVKTQGYNSQAKTRSDVELVANTFIDYKTRTSNMT